MANFGTKVGVTGLNKALKDIRGLADTHNAKVDNLLSMLVEDGKQIAADTVGGYGAIETGELYNSIQGKVDTTVHEGYIYSTSEHAKYVEFGTGIIGKYDASPSAIYNGWQYDVNNHGYKGWTYYKNGVFHHTQGYISRPFMYNTAARLKQDLQKYIRGAFKK